MHLQALLFDIDGTLIDTNDLHVRCWIEAFAHFGKQFERDVIRHQIGKGGDLLVPDLLNAKEMRTFGEELKKYRSKLYKDEYMPQAKPFDGAKRALETLHARGIRIALASSSNEDEVEYYTQLLGVENLLAGSTSKKDAAHSKPSPEIFRAALERTGADEAKTFAVGDTPYDILAAHRIPLPIVAVLSGGFERELLHKAEYLFDNVTQIPESLDELERWFD
ncbi:MAG TPA: HAD family hydrolase [Thermoanaerobaculia bacterium]|nr:HAD family hydrolase [Thermoanaerobaculia bacterium]